MIKKGKVHCFGDNIDTDQIVPSQYLVLPSIKDMIKHAMEPVDAEFYKIFVSGDIIVGGRNFGCGSSREQAVAVFKEMGVSCIIAESFARIYYRNFINSGIPVIELESTKCFYNGDYITIDFDLGRISKEGNTDKYDFVRYSEHVQRLINCGGLIEYFKKERNTHKWK